MFLPKIVNKFVFVAVLATNLSFAMNKKPDQDSFADQKAAQLRQIAQAADLALKQSAQEQEEAIQKLKKEREEWLRAQDTKFEQLLASLKDPNKNPGEELAKFCGK